MGHKGMTEPFKVALELQPCCGKRSGIGLYTYEIARRMQDGDGLAFYGNLFNFFGRNDNTAALQGIRMPITTRKLMPYGIYRRVWDVVPIPYSALFPGGADLSVFFNYVAPPRIKGKVITAVYDMTFSRFPETMDPRNRRHLQKGLARSVARSDRIVTISEFSKSEIVELLGVDAHRVRVVPCAPVLSKETANFDVCKSKFGVKKPYILYVGTIEPRKNLARLIAAFSLLKRDQGIPHQLVLAGGAGWANDSIYRAAQEMDDVVFTGYISEAEKNALYQNAAAFVFPSLYEGFGIPPLEAMHFGCPVVCAAAASLPEVVSDAAELVDPLDETAIAQGIWNVLSSPARAAELTSRGRRRAAGYTWDGAAQRFLGICKEALGL